jgi:transposase
MTHRARRIHKTTLLVSDNARFHTTRKAETLMAELRPWVKIVWLPKYASTLNEIEPFWKLVKRMFFGNTLYRSVEEFERHVDEIVDRLSHDPDALLALQQPKALAS